MSERRSISEMQQKIVDDNIVAATAANDREKVDLCLKKGADINARGNWYNRTPLMYATAYARAEFVEFLLTKNPDLFLKDSSGKTVFDIAEEINDSAVKKKVNRALLAALPDAQPEKTAEESVTLAGEIPVLKPIEFDRQKKGGKSFQL